LTVKNNRGKRSRICLKAYRLFLLEGEDALGTIGLSDDEFQKMKEFHYKLEAGQSAYIVGRNMRLPEFLSKGIGRMYDDWRTGREVRDLYNANLRRPRVGRCYELMLSGFSYNKLLVEGFSECEIEGAKAFQKYERCDMLPAMIAQKTGLAPSTIKKMQRMYIDSLKNIEARVEIREELIA
jgi:hypothetical protein